MQDKFNSRKLALTFVLFITATVFLVLGFATFVDWSDFLQWIFGIYAAGNVGEHYTNVGKPTIIPRKRATQPSAEDETADVDIEDL